MEPFFERPIINSLYEYPGRHWDLDDQGQPTQRILENRRRAEFTTPIPKPKKRRDGGKQAAMAFDEGVGLSDADLHIADDPKNTGQGNLFVIFGEPNIDIMDATEHDGVPGQIQVKVNGVDVFHPNTGEVRSDGAEGIACWFIDTDYNEESFFVRRAYFLGANALYSSLKSTLTAKIDEDGWATLHSDTSRPFARPKAGRIAVKVINHLGNELMGMITVPMSWRRSHGQC